MAARMKTPQRAQATSENHVESKPEHPLTSPQPKFLKAREALCNSLVEREAEVQLLLTALVAKEHVLLVGQPGTAKSHMLRSLSKWLNGPPSDYFEALLTKFTTPEELFGPISVKGLKEDKFTRIITGKLPEARLVFLDEFFKASSAIANTVLTAMNERLYDNGYSPQPIPLITLMAASNEWPNDDNGGKELGALFDRFLFRKTVKTVTKMGRKELLRRAVAQDPCLPAYVDTISPQELDLAHKEAMALDWDNEAKKALVEILDAVNDLGVFPGDRRMFKAIGAARANAYLSGASQVLPEHLEVLAHVLWDDPTEQPGKVEKVVARIANPVGNKVLEILDQAQDVSAKSDEKYKASANPSDRSTIAQGVKAKLKELRNELRPYQPLKLPLCTQAVGWIDDMLKTWDYKELNMQRE